MRKKIGKQTVTFSNAPYIIGEAAVGGRKEGEGPMRDCFDYLLQEDMFGEKIRDAIIAENSNDCALGITAKLIEEKWDKIRSIIDTVPTYKELIEKYEVLGVKSDLGDIDVQEEKCNLLLEYSPLVRNRLTLMRLRRTVIREENK